MTVQEQIDDRHLAVARLALDGAQRRVEAHVARLEKARVTGCDAATVLACSRAVHVAQQQHLEALAEVAGVRRALAHFRSDP